MVLTLFNSFHLTYLMIVIVFIILTNTYDLICYSELYSCYGILNLLVLYYNIIFPLQGLFII